MGLAGGSAGVGRYARPRAGSLKLAGPWAVVCRAFSAYEEGDPWLGRSRDFHHRFHEFARMGWGIANLDWQGLGELMGWRFMSTDLENRVNRLAIQVEGLESREKGPFYAIDSLSRIEILLETRIRALQSLVLELAQGQGIDPHKAAEVLERKCRYYEERHRRELQSRVSVDEAIRCDGSGPVVEAAEEGECPSIFD